MAACGAPGGNNTPVASPEVGSEASSEAQSTTQEEKVELELWVPGTQEDMHYKAFSAAADRFNEENENIRVTVVLGGATEEYNKKITMMGDTDSLPDFFETSDALVEGFGETGVLTEISNDIDSDQEWSSWDYATGAYDTQKQLQGGKVYGVPTVMDAQGFFFNKAILEEHGLSVPATWDEFTNMVKVLKDAGITPIAHGAGDPFSVWGYYGIFGRYGMEEKGAEIKAGTTTWKEAMIEPFQRIQELAEMGAYPEGTASTSYSQALEMFLAGDAAVMGTGAWDCPKIAEAGLDAAFSWGPTFSDSSYDQKVGVKPVSYTLYAGSALGESDAKREAGIKFLKYICSPETSKLLIENELRYPAYITDISDLGLDALTVDIYEKIGDDYAPIGESYNYVDNKLVDTFWNSVTSIINQSITAEEAAQQLDDFYKLMG